LITLAAIWKYQEVGPVLQLWAAMGTLSGALVTYFFTREQVKEQESRARMFQAAYEASEQQRINGGKQVLAIATKLNSDATSPEIRGLFEYLQGIGGELVSRPAKATGLGPGKRNGPQHPTASPTDSEFHDMLFRGSPKPTP
jgi:hypothetical protein